MTIEGPSAAFASSLDELDPLSCAALDAQLAKDSAAVTLFNDTSNAAISAFHAGRHDEGCRGFVAVRG